MADRYWDKNRKVSTLLIFYIYWLIVEGVSSVTKSRRLQRTGHVRMLPYSRTVKLLWEKAPSGKRTLGRPRLRWNDNIAKELKTMNIVELLDAIPDIQQWMNR